MTVSSLASLGPNMNNFRWLPLFFRFLPSLYALFTQHTKKKAHHQSNYTVKHLGSRFLTQKKKKTYISYIIRKLRRGIWRTAYDRHWFSLPVCMINVEWFWQMLIVKGKRDESWRRVLMNWIYWRVTSEFSSC